MTVHARVSGEIALLSARDYDLMIGAGVLSGRKVELRDGILIEMAPEHIPHARVKTELGFNLRDELRRLGRNDLEAIIEVSMETGPRSVPEPDIVVMRRSATERLLHARDVVLAIEVASSSHTVDLGWKAAQYAGAAIAEYWVVDVKAQAVHVHRQPVGDDYTAIEVLRFDELLRSIAIEGLEVRIADLTA